MSSKRNPVKGKRSRKAEQNTNPRVDCDFQLIDLNEYAQDSSEEQKRGKWTNEEDEKLHKSICEFGAKNWRNIAKHVPGRSAIQCLHRWTKILKPGLIKGPWTKEEDLLLKNWVDSNGPTMWAEASEVIKGRNAKQIRERWNNVLDPNMNKSDWTPSESRIIFELYLKFGSRWSRLKKFLEGRTENNIKNRFYSVLRKVKGRKDRERGTEGSNKPKKGDKLNHLMSYVDEAIQYLNADVNNLPQDLSLESDTIIYSSTRRKHEIESINEQQRKSKSSSAVEEDKFAKSTVSVTKEELHDIDGVILANFDDEEDESEREITILNLMPFDKKKHLLQELEDKKKEKKSKKKTNNKPLNKRSQKQKQKKAEEDKDEENDYQIEHKIFNVKNNDCELKLDFGLKCSSKSTDNQAEIELKKYEVILDAMKKMSDKVQSVIDSKT